jgi:arginase
LIKKLTLIGIPIYSLSEFRGMAEAVSTLRVAGVTDILEKSAESFVDLGDLESSGIVSDTGPENLRNFPQFLKDTDTIAATAGKVGAGDFLFCLGGGCELIVGTLAGLKGVFTGKPGVVWLDAHGDFNTPETSGSGYIGGMGLAMACGRGPRLSPMIETARPLLSEENIVHIDSRALDPAEYQAMSTSAMKLYSAESARSEGLAKVAKDTANYLSERCDWIVCHLDVDAIDPEFNPGVNFPEPGGLSTVDVITIMRALQRTNKLRVFNLTAYNPLFDRNAKSLNTLLNLVAELFS